VSDILNLAAPCSSVNDKAAKFTAPGLGDRIHLVTVAFLVSKELNKKVMLHLTHKQSIGPKRKSFEEILALFPKGKVNIRYHTFDPVNEIDWLRFLNCAEPFYYGDHPGRFQSQNGIDVSVFLQSNEAFLAGFPGDERHQSAWEATLQWDSTASNRTIGPAKRRIVEKYYADRGVTLTTVGGLSNSTQLRHNLNEIFLRMRQSRYHVGVDSGFMHLAQLCLPPEDLHLYVKPNGYWSHHVFRLLDRGAQLNVALGDVKCVRRYMQVLRYDTPKLHTFLLRLRLVDAFRGIRSLKIRVFGG